MVLNFVFGLNKETFWALTLDAMRLTYTKMKMTIQTLSGTS